VSVLMIYKKNKPHPKPPHRGGRKNAGFDSLPSGDGWGGVCFLVEIIHFSDSL